MTMTKLLRVYTDEKVRALAKDVIRIQQAEIVKMQTWLAERQAAKRETR